MTELFYTALDLAFIIKDLDLNCHDSYKLTNKVYELDKLFLQPIYRNDFGKLYKKVEYWSDYLNDKESLDEDFSKLKKDFRLLGKKINEEDFITDNFEFDLFFKRTRIQIIFNDTYDYIRIKLRTILNSYGYKRRTENFLQYFYERMLFYHLQTFLRGNKECDINEISLDEMITLRII